MMINGINRVIDAIDEIFFLLRVIMFEKERKKNCNTIETIAIYLSNNRLNTILPYRFYI